MSACRKPWQDYTLSFSHCSCSAKSWRRSRSLTASKDFCPRPRAISSVAVGVAKIRDGTSPLRPKSGSPIRQLFPGFADELVRCQTLESFEPSGKVARGDEVGEVAPELVVIFVAVAFNRGLFEHAVYALSLTVGPGMAWFGQAVINVALSAGRFESVRSEAFPTFQRGLNVRCRRTCIARHGEVNPVVSQHCVDLVEIAVSRARKKSATTRVVAFSSSSVSANLDVQSIATNR